MKFRSIFLTVLTLFALTIGATIQAQDDMGFDACFGLDEADCAVINDASANGLGGAESYTIDVSIDFAGDELQGLFGLLAGFAPDLDLGTLGDLSAATFTVDGTFDIIATDDEDGALRGSYTASWSADGGDVTEVAMDIIVLENMVYMDLGDGNGWQSVDLDALAENEDLAGALEGFGGMMGMDMADDGEDMDDMDDAAVGLDIGALGGIFGILDLPGFVSYERAGDDFTFAVDFEVLQLLLEEENEELLNELVTEAAAIDPQLAFFIPLLPTLISDGGINAVQTVDTEANVVTDIAFDTDLALALGIIDGSGATTTIDLAVDLSFSNFDAVEAIEAPAESVDATDDFAAWLSSMLPAEEEMEEESDD